MQPGVVAVIKSYELLCAVARLHFGGGLAGRFLLCPPVGNRGAPIVLAASIAGAASLTIESSATVIREAVRNGVVDFAVNSLDEALRILKNELRKRQAVCVLLQAELTRTLAEAAERGVQPDLLALQDNTASETADPRLAAFLARGSVMLEPHSASEETASVPGVLVAWRTIEPAGQWLRRLDLLAAASLPEQDLERRHWVTRAPRYLPRTLRSERSVRMNAAEASHFVASVKTAVRNGDIAMGVELQIGSGTPVRIQPNSMMSRNSSPG